MKTKYIFATIALVASSLVMGQRQPCFTDEHRLELIKQNPQLLELEKQQELLEQGSKMLADTVTIYTIPIVFHILHNYGTENITDAQVYDAVRIINEDYRKLNADYTTTKAPFHPADAKIEFRLAQKDAYGVCTNGIERIATPETYIGDDNSKNVIDHSQWPRSKYINVWVVAKIKNGAAGYAIFPINAGTNNDGVMILNDYVGGIGTSNYYQGRALTHEIGHMLNLSHVWGNNNNPGTTCGDDGVTDTPNTKGWTSCDLVNNKICNTSVVENVQNYMEYSYCETMFSKGQCARMRSALTSTVASRSSLWTTSNLSATGVSLPSVLCKAEFGASRTLICENDNIAFTDAVWNGTPNNWNWTFQGGNPGNSIDTIPIINYPTPGTFDVTLNVSNGSGSPSITKTSYINVSSLTAQYNGSTYTEGFEGGQAAMNTDWIVNDIDGSGKTWKAKPSVAYTGSYSMWIDNYNEDSTDVDEIISPSMNLSGMNTPKLYFKMAYAQYTATDPDNLRIYISKDCGKTWFLKFNKSGGAIKSVTAPVTSAFTPSGTSQWRADSITIPASYVTANTRFKFYWKNGYGNNVYIDDINIHGIATGVQEDLSSRLSFAVMPNPTNNITELSFDLPTTSNVSLVVYDMLGKQVTAVENNNALSSGLHRYTLECGTYNKGIYFAKLVVDKQQFIKKIVVN